MKILKLNSILFVIAMVFITLQSCEKKTITKEQNPNVYTENDFEFSQTFTTSNKSLVSAQFELFTDNKELLKMGNQITIEPVFEEMKTENINITNDETGEFEDEKPDLYLNILNISLPEGSKGYRVILPRNNSKSWDFDYDWSVGTGTWDVKKLRVKKTNRSGKVKVRIGVLENSHQNWYRNRINTTLKDKNEDTSYSPSSSYYRIRLRIKLKSGGEAEYTVWYYGGTTYTGGV